MSDTTQGQYGVWEEAQQVLPGGVNASARLNSVLGKAFIVSHGTGGVITDIDGREYIDLNMSHGASLLGYGHASICNAVSKALSSGILCAHETLHQITLAQKITQLVPSAEMVRFCGTGTETTWHAVRLARAYSRKSIIIKFEGHFHGYNDYLAYSKRPPLDVAGPPDSPYPYPDTQGIPEAVRDYILVMPFNNIEVLASTVKRRYNEIAAIIMEPVNYNSGTILPVPGYLEAVRDLTSKHNVTLIFDEILSGFQTGTNCVQGYFGVTPDITILGKALGGGMPISAIVGKKEIMQTLAPVGKVMHSGTYIAHPTAVLAAISFLDEVSYPDFYPSLHRLCQYLTDNLRLVFREMGVTVKIQSLGSRFSLLFGIPEEHHVINYRDTVIHDRAAAQKFYAMMLKEGVYFNPSWHHGVCAAHSVEQLDLVLEAAERVAREMRVET